MISQITLSNSNTQQQQLCSSQGQFAAVAKLFNCQVRSKLNIEYRLLHTVLLVEKQRVYSTYIASYSSVTSYRTVLKSVSQAQGPTPTAAVPVSQHCSRHLQEAHQRV